MNSEKNILKQYVDMLQTGQYLVVFNKEGEICLRICINCEDNTKHVIYNIFTDITFERWKESYRYNEFMKEDATLYKYVICNREEYVKYVKDSIKKMTDAMREHKDSNCYRIIQEIEQDGGKFVSFSDRDDDCGLLVCATSTDEDYYWVYIDNDFKVHYSSAVGGYDSIAEEDINRHCPNIRNAVNTDKETIAHILNEDIKNRIDYIFTPIIIKR